MVRLQPRQRGMTTCMFTSPVALPGTLARHFEADTPHGDD